MNYSNLLAADSYYYIRINGLGHSPSRDEMIRCLELGRQPTFHLDANACIHLGRYGDPVKRRKLDVKEKSQVEMFFATAASLADIGITIYDGLGVAELATNPATCSLDSDKVSYLDDQVHRALALPIDLAINNKALPQILESKKLGSRLNTIQPILPLLQAFHACYLKIVQLKRSSPGKRNSLKNLEAFLNWQREELGSVLLLPLQASVAIFGGDDRFAKFCGALDPVLDYRKIWAAAWDTFHLQMIQVAWLVPLEGFEEYPMLITGDGYFYQTFCKTELLSGIVQHNLPVASFSTIFSEYPFYAGLEEEVKRLLDTLNSRYNVTVNEFIGRDHLSLQAKAKKAWEALAPDPKVYAKH